MRMESLGVLSGPDFEGDSISHDAKDFSPDE